MKFLTFLTVVLVMLCWFSFAELEGYDVFPRQTIATNTAAVVELPSPKISGKPVRFVFDVPAGATSAVASVTLTTVVGNGASFSTAQTIYSNASVTNDLTTNFASTVYLWKDKTSCTVSNSWTNTITVKGLLIVDDEP